MKVLYHITCDLNWNWIKILKSNNILWRIFVSWHREVRNLNLWWTQFLQSYSTAVTFMRTANGRLIHSHHTKGIPWGTLDLRGIPSWQCWDGCPLPSWSTGAVSLNIFWWEHLAQTVSKLSFAKCQSSNWIFCKDFGGKQMSSFSCSGQQCLQLQSWIGPAL
jgi:hypothetical protein